MVLCANETQYNYIMQDYLVLPLALLCTAFECAQVIMHNQLIISVPHKRSAQRLRAFGQTL